MLGIPTHRLLDQELDHLDGLLAEGARLVFRETPTKPALEIFGIAALAEQIHARGALLIVC
jgi:cystathionine beta-lyase/cystathionine gamma-synthase